LNEIGQVRLSLAQPLYLDAYADCRGTGSFVLVDPLTNATVAAGMVDRQEVTHGRPPAGVVLLGRAERELVHGHRALAVALTGPAERTAAVLGELERRLLQRGIQALRVDAAFVAPLEAVTAAAMPQVAVSLIERLIEAGHVVLSDLHGVAEPGRLAPADLLRVHLGDQGDAELCVEIGDLSNSALATRVLTWLGDGGHLAGNLVQGRGAGI
ncbi:MAG: hypothetical protein HY902_04335, partial [Deltaproteobacteria bacterium]|nr:hypothetical protein [Deltaproteobacteria bacterium]